MNALQTFQFQSHSLAVITDEHGEPWFIAKEVAEILDYSDAYEMTKKLDDDEKSNRQIAGLGPETGGKGTTIINESGLWSSVLRSTKPEAKAVKKWLTSEVLPAIRKTGGYSLKQLPAPDSDNTELDAPLNLEQLKRLPKSAAFWVTTAEWRAACLYDPNKPGRQENKTTAQRVTNAIGKRCEVFDQYRAWGEDSTRLYQQSLEENALLKENCALLKERADRDYESEHEMLLAVLSSKDREMTLLLGQIELYKEVISLLKKGGAQ